MATELLSARTAVSGFAAVLAAVVALSASALAARLRPALGSQGLARR